MPSPENNKEASELELLIAQARRNESIASKLFDIELEMLKASTLAGFVDHLTAQVRDRFELDDVWFIFTDIAVNKRIVGMLDEQGGLSERLALVTTRFLGLTGSATTPLLLNKPASIAPFIPRHLQNRINSVALLPLHLENRLSGALVLGSSDVSRYQPDMEAFFLRQLAIKVSAGLTSIWAREQLRLLATRDPLTGLRNRRDMEAALEQELTRANRYGKPMAVLFIDLDNFKMINDTWGHEAGDQCLVTVARQLEAFMRRDDSLFRFAGDEFVALLPNQTETEGHKIADRMLGELSRNPLTLAGQDVIVRFSFGVACIKPHSNISADELLRQADQRLYAMKRSMAES